MDDFPKPSELIGLLDKGRLEPVEAVRLILEHLAVLYQYKNVDLLLLNGLLRDMAAVTAELHLARPSAVLTDHLKALAQQAQSREAAAGELPPKPSDLAADADVAVASSDLDEG
jgi:hypothetical protein